MHYADAIRRRAQSPRAPRAPSLAAATAARASMLLLTLVAAEVQAHAVEHRVERAEAVVVTLTAGADAPLADATYRVYRPGGGEPFASGRTDSRGSLAFRPDASGQWRILVSGADGHGASLSVAIDESGSLVRSGQARWPRAALVLAGVGYIVGFAGLLAWWRRPR